MSLAQLIKHFSDREDFPIHVDRVKEWLISQDFQDEIQFYPIKDMNPGVLRGQIKQFTYQKSVYGEPTMCSNILFAENMSLCWRRFACCKEMMHILDGAAQSTATREAIEKLTFDLVSPRVNGAGYNNPPLDADRSAELKALCVLAPIKTIEKLRAKYADGSRTAYDIAVFLRLPQVYISFLFSPQYATAYALLSEAPSTVVSIKSEV
jgi:hypothetical protein